MVLVAVFDLTGDLVCAPAATKHALHGFFNGFRNELALSNVHNVSITLCAIGATDTEGTVDIKHQVGSAVSWDPPEDAALSIVRGVAWRHRDIYHPHYLVFPSKIMHNLVPGVLDFFLQMAMQN